MRLEDRITITPGVRGGKPCIKGTRITVYDIVFHTADYAIANPPYAGYAGWRCSVGTIAIGARAATGKASLSVSMVTGLNNMCPITWSFLTVTSERMILARARRVSTSWPLPGGRTAAR